MSDWDARTTHDAAEGPQWVSAAEAADTAGVTPGTVRYWARNGLIVSEVVPGPAGERTLVRLDEVLRHARQQSAASSAHRGPAGGEPGKVVTDLPARTSELAPILKSVPELMAQLTAATDRAARAETKVEFLSAQLQDMRRRLAEAEAEAGRTPSPQPTVPEAWEVPGEPPGAADVAPSPEAAGASGSPGSGGWPAPPATDTTDWGAATSDTPAGTHVDAEPGPESLDWGAGERVDTPEAAEEAPAGALEGEHPHRLTLEELWAGPSTKGAAPPEPPAPAPRDGVDWHPPASGGDAPPPVAPPSRRANATMPEEDFYGPRRRRRWFRRRR
jgi:hypothetical protein